MKKFALFTLLLLASVLHAQIIEDDGTEVLDEIRGEALFRLDAGADVYSYRPEGGWYKVRKEVYVKPSEVIDDEVLPAGTKLKDEDGNEIGEVLREMEIVEGKIVDGFRSDDPYRAILEGYLFKTKFEDNSIPEARISEILGIKNRTEQQRQFSELREYYDFEKRVFEDLTAYVYREENKTAADEKDFRLIVLFRGETSPYAVITNDHEVTAEKIKVESDLYPYRVIYFYKPPTRQKQLVEEQILYTYLAL